MYQKQGDGSVMAYVEDDGTSNSTCQLTTNGKIYSNDDILKIYEKQYMLFYLETTNYAYKLTIGFAKKVELLQMKIW